MRGRPAASVCGLHTGVTTIRASGATSRRHQPRGRQADRQGDGTVDLHDGTGQLQQRLSPDVQDDVCADHGVAQDACLLRVQTLGILAILGVGEIEIAGNPQQVAHADVGAGAAGSGSQIRLFYAEIAPGVEDDRDGLADRKTIDPH